MIDKEKEKSITESTLQHLFFGAIIAVSFATSYGFGKSFLPALAPEIFGSVRAEASGFIVAILLDISALTWQYIRSSLARSVKQMEIANEMSKVTIAGAIALTISYLVLINYSLVVSPMVEMWAGYIGLGVVIAIFSWSFYRLWCFNQHDPSVVERRATLEINNKAVMDAIKETNARILQEMEMAINEVVTRQHAGKMDELRRMISGEVVAKVAMDSPAPLIEAEIKPEPETEEATSAGNFTEE